MPKTALITTEKKPSKPILIVDKEGALGKLIAQKLKNEFLVAFVSRLSLTEENIVSIPFIKKVPSIPDNTFSHIILVAQDSTKNLLKVFQKKAQKDGGELSVIFNKENAEKKIIHEALDFYSKTNVIIVGELFAQDFIYNPQTDLSKLIIDAKAFEKVEIPNDGAKEQSPVLLQDAVDAIIEAIFVDEKEKFFYVFPQNSTTLLSLALMLKKKNPNLKLDFVKRKKEKEQKLSIPSGGKFLLLAPYDFDEQIKKINLEKIRVEQYIKEKNKSGFPRMTFLPLVVFLITLLILPVLSTVIFLSLGTFFLNKNSAISEKSYQIATNSFPVLRQELSFLSSQPAVSIFENSISSKILALQVMALKNTADDEMKNVLTGKSINPARDLGSAIQNYKNTFIISQQQNFPSNLDKLISLSQYFPGLLGMDREKNYLVMLQNSSVLRPGGGKIEFYGILTLEKGSVKSFKIYDAKSLSTGVNGRTEPPFAIRRYLPNQNWYLEDSNFDVDFSKDAAAAAIFLNSQTKQAVDGVIGVDSYFVKDLLKLTGEVEVNSKSINSNNFSETVDKSEDTNFKKSFYTDFFQKISLNKLSFNNLFQAFLSSASQKHIVFAFNDQSSQLAFSTENLGSTLLNDEDSDLNDFLGISEANFGNFNNEITRKINHTVNIQNDGTVLETADVLISNGAEVSYKNYLRIILPLNTQVSSISINGVEQRLISAITDPSVYENKKFSAPSGLEVEKYNEGNNTVYGFLINIPGNTTERITTDFSLSEKLKPESSYGVRIFKQPGVDSVSYNLKINTEALKAVSYPSSFLVNNDGGKLSTIIDKDTDLNFRFLPK